VALLAWALMGYMKQPLFQQGQGTLPMGEMTIGSTTLTVEIASTPAEQQAGLSGRPSLALGHGMLFVFGTPGEYGFWMKEMLFSLDIIFINSEKSVVTVYPELTPGTYPEAFYPANPALYVLEVPAGFAAQHGIVEGSKVVLQ